MEELTPFGYRYGNGICMVKLRLHPNKFKEIGIADLGDYTPTRSGYIIFEATFDVKGEQFKEFNRRMRKPATTK